MPAEKYQVGDVAGRGSTSRERKSSSGKHRHHHGGRKRSKHKRTKSKSFSTETYQVGYEASRGSTSRERKPSSEKKKHSGRHGSTHKRTKPKNHNKTDVKNISPFLKLPRLNVLHPMRNNSIISTRSIGSDTGSEQAFNSTTKEILSAGTIDPDSPIAVLWSWVIFFLTVYNAFVIPFRAAFGFVSEDLGFFFFFDLLGDACFVADIALNFRKGFYRFGMHKVMDKEQIELQYRQTFFLLDVIASLPTDLIQIALGRLFPMTRVFKLLRLLHLVHQLNELELSPNVNKTSVSLFKYLFYLSFSVHALGCLWFSTHQYQGFGANEFVPSLDVAHAPQLAQYIFSLNWTISLMSNTALQSNGYPTTHLDLLVALTTMLIGVISISYTIGNVSRVFKEQAAKRREFEHQRKGVKFMLESFKCSRRVVTSTLDYYDYQWKKNGGLGTHEWLKTLPRCLYQDVTRCDVQAMMCQIEGLKDLSSSILTRLLEEVDIVEYVPGSIVLPARILIDHVYFIIDGEFELTIQDKNKEDSAIVLRKDSVYGLWPSIKRENSIGPLIAKTFGEVGILSRESLFKVLKLFPHDFISFKEFILRESRKECLPYHNHVVAVQSLSMLDYDYSRFRRKTFSFRYVLRQVLPVAVVAADLLNFIILPFRLMFSFDVTTNLWLHPIYIFERLADGVLYFEICCNLRSSVLRDASSISDPREARRLYLRTRLPIDIICIFPIDVFMMLAGGDIFNPIYRLPRLLRFPRIVRSIGALREASMSSISTVFLHLGVLSFLYLLFAHAVASVYFSISFYSDFPSSEFIPGDRLRAAAPMSRYLFSVFNSYNMLNRLGSRISPRVEMPSHMILAILSCMLGIVIGSLLIGQMGSIVGGHSAAGQLNRKLYCVSKFSRSKNLPDSTRQQISRVLLYRWSQTRGYNFNWIFQTLPRPIKVQLISKATFGRFGTQPPLINMNRSFIEELIEIVEFEFLPKGQTLFMLGDTTKRVYYLVSGGIAMHHTDHAGGKPFRKLGVGQFAGLSNTLLGMHRYSFTASITKDSSLLVFSSRRLSHVFKRHPSSFELLQLRAEHETSSAGVVEFDTLHATESNVNLFPQLTEYGWKLKCQEEPNTGDISSLEPVELTKTAKRSTKEDENEEDDAGQGVTQ